MRYARTIESMETSPKGILILYPSRLKNVLTLLLSLRFTAGGVWMIADREGSGWYVALFFGLCSAVFAAQLALTVTARQKPNECFYHYGGPIIFWLLGLICLAGARLNCGGPPYRRGGAGRSLR